MNLRWNNIITAALAAIVLTFALRHCDSCRAALATVESLAPRGGADDRFVGFMVLGVLAVALVAIVKLLTQNRRQDPPERRRDPPED
jgi:hypothetical protein